MTEGTPVIIKKKKGGHGHAHHGGSWKVAYADFVTAMMAFFMVMWIMGLSDQTKAQIAGYFNDPTGFMKTMPRSKSVMNIPGSSRPTKGTSTGQGNQPIDSRQHDKKLKDEILKVIINSGQLDLTKLLNQMEIKVTEEGLRVEMVETTGAVFFESGSATIRPLALKLIQKIAPVLASSRRNMIVEGHTDAKPYQSSGYNNMDLSADRAKALAHALMSGGVEEKQIREYRGKGSSQLKDTANPYSFVNRRVTLLLPYGTASTNEQKLPADQLRDDMQGVFRTPVDVGPGSPNVAPAANAGRSSH